MFQTILGLIIAFAPLLLILNFKDKIIGLLYISTTLFGLHLAIAFTTQLLHIFNYPTILLLNSFIAISSLYFIIIKDKTSVKIKVNYLVLLGFIIIFFQLWSVHYLYTGSITTINGFEKVNNNYYPYPYFSDEWIGASLVKYAIGNHSLPNVNPLANNTKATNPLMMFFSFISEIFLLLNLNPINGWPVFSLFSGLIICLLSYILLRKNNISPFFSIFTAISITYITNAVNLPGIWYLLPYTIGLILFLISLILLSIKDLRWAMLSSLLSIIFYTPIIIFIAPIFIIEFIKNRRSIHTFRYASIAILVSIISITLILGLIINSFNLFIIIQSLPKFIIRPVLDNGIPVYRIWNIIPIYLLPIVLIGLVKIFKDKIYSLISPIVTGLIFWFIYIFTKKVFIIEYPRVIAITSILLTITIGFGLNWLWQIFTKKYIILSQEDVKIAIKSIFVFYIIVTAFYYTDKNSWSKFLLRINIENTVKIVSPAAPTNHYLHKDDLTLFEHISNKRFISLPWKGLILGTITDNFPIDSKPSIITNNILPYNTFISADCDKKEFYMKKFRIDYAYTRQFNCRNFELVGTSSEELYLYKYNNLKDNKIF